MMMVLQKFGWMHLLIFIRTKLLSLTITKIMIVPTGFGHILQRKRTVVIWNFPTAKWHVRRPFRKAFVGGT